MSETKATVTMKVWRDQVDYKKTDGWKIVTINASEGTVVIRNSTREIWNQTSMRPQDRKRMYRSQVKDGNVEFLRAEMSDDVLSSKEMDDLLHQGRDPRKKWDGKRNVGQDLDHSTTFTRGAKSDD